MATEDFTAGQGNLSRNILITIIVFQSIALYNVVELTFIIWTVFKRHSGTYFWSFVVATYGILIYAIGFILEYAGPRDQSARFVYVTLILIGWSCMLTGQSMVLWSRLHIILRDAFKLKLVLYMIIINCIIIYPPISVVLFGTTASNSNASTYATVYSVYEKIQVTLIFVQEVIISLIYVYETVKLTKVLSIMRDQASSRGLRNYLIAINIIIIILDIGILSLEYADQYLLQTAYKGFVYSVKLKLEFTILNRLVEMVTGNREANTSSTEPGPGSSSFGRSFATATDIDLQQPRPTRERSMVSRYSSHPSIGQVRDRIHNLQHAFNFHR